MHTALNEMDHDSFLGKLQSWENPVWGQEAQEWDKVILWIVKRDLRKWDAYHLNKFKSVTHTAPPRSLNIP